MTVPQLVEYHGYPVESHTVTTSDGYILTLHRIPHGVNQTNSTGRPVVFLNHCLLCSSADYLLNTPDKALGYMLADAGYDVWLGNFRGNTYSRKHKSLSPAHLDFWEFSWDQMGEIDLPAMIDYTLAATGQKTLKLVGFSMGTTTTMVMLSEHPEYNDKISVAALMGPVAYMKNMKGILEALAPLMKPADAIATLAGVGTFFPSWEWFEKFVDTYCSEDSEVEELCVEVVSSIAGFDIDLFPRRWLPVILSHTPAGTSFHTMTHYIQLQQSGRFCKYDYGVLGNWKHYQQASPPEFKLENVKVPTGLFWGKNDFLANPTDIAHLAPQLPNLKQNNAVDWDKFNHMDFVWATQAYELVYKQVMDFISKY